MTTIGTNTASIRAATASAKANSELATSMQRLSTSKRINSAKDDAAGLGIAASMTSQIKGMSQAVRNANDAASMAQTAEGALGEVTNMLQRVRELAVQSASGTYGDTNDRANLNAEVTALKSQINDVLTKTEFNGVKLFTGAAGTSGVVTVQTGAASDSTATIDFAAVTLTGVADATVATAAGATAAITTVDTAIQTVSTKRAALGASQSQMQSVVNSLSDNIANLSDARSRIEDTDYSAETAALAKAQILSQASTAMLSQANQSQQSVLKLLQ